MHRKIIFIGDSPRSGTYLLRIAISYQTSLCFGRFNGGREILVSAGEYLYVGSALTKTDRPALLRRVVRHASRTNDRPPHRLRRALLTAGADYAFHSDDLFPRRPKRLHWHIDYLMELPQAELKQVYLIGEGSVSEHAVADWLLDQPTTYLLAAGLGASDHAGGTHLLGICASADWWCDLPNVLQGL